jgi:hypothetical protein
VSWPTCRDMSATFPAKVFVIVESKYELVCNSFFQKRSLVFKLKLKSIKIMISVTARRLIIC